MIRVFRHYCATPVVALFLADGFILLLSFALAVVFFGAPVRDDVSVTLGKAAVATGMVQVTLAMADLYDPVRVSRLPEGDRHLLPGRRILLGAGLGGIALAVLYSLVPDLALGGRALPLGLVLGLAGVLGLRATTSEVEGVAGSERVLVVGGGRQARRFLRQVVGAREVGHTEFVLCSRPETLLSEVERVRPDRVVVAADRGHIPRTRDLVKLRLKGIPVEGHARYAERVFRRVPVGLLRDVDLAMGPGLSESRGEEFFGRVLGTLATALLLLALGPVFLVVAGLVKATSRGPVLFVQDRVGRGGKVFRLYKFRTMRQGSEAGGARWAVMDDERITPVGRFLRRFRLDELPQMINVLKGDMALVGPRPEQPALAEELRRRIPFYSLREAVRPGLTGWAQINMGYAGTIEESREKLTYDLYYVKNRSLFLDLVILFRTVKVVLFGRGAR